MLLEKITVINYYYLFPVDNGGKMAIRDFYAALSKWFDITIVCLVFDNFLKDEIYLNERLRVISLPVPQEFHTKANLFYNAYASTNSDPAYTMTIIRECHKSNSLLMELEKITADSTIIITEHVYTYRLAKLLAHDKRLWYRAQNVEYDYKLHTWKSINLPEAIYQELLDLEYDCCNNSDLVLTITDEDAARFIELYGLSENKILNISAGYSSVENIELLLPSQRNGKKPSENVTALFISSYSEVALLATYEIIKVAEELPNVSFFIVGNVGNKIDIINLPKNVTVTGLISDNEKKMILQAADVALNPITGGSGLNIKMLEYFAYGVPVISTTFGARGISVENGVNCIISDMYDLKNSIHKFMKLSFDERDGLAIRAHELYMTDYTWDKCALKLVTHISVDDSLCLDNLTQYQPVDIRESAIAIIDKNKAIYIYGAGEWGKTCLKLLNEFGMNPLAFLDIDENKWDNHINNIPIQSPEQVLPDRHNCQIIFALADYVQPIANYLQKGFRKENLIFAFRGEFLFNYIDGHGRLPFYFDHEKLKKSIEQRLYSKSCQ